MLIEHKGIKATFADAQRGKKSRHSVADRTKPKIWQFDYLVLSELFVDMQDMVRALEPSTSGALVAIDIGSARSPYKELLERRGYAVKTLDVSDEFSPDVVGAAGATGLADASVDVVVCTQVLEHLEDPAGAVCEFLRILKPGGALIVSAPHIWFYHPQPGDFWRFTQEGMLHLLQSRGFEVKQLRLARGSFAALMQVVAFLIYGVFGRVAAPVFALLNVAGIVGDKLFYNELFSLNVSCYARKS